MPKKVAILNTTHFANKGSMGRLEGTIRCIEATIPDSRLTIFHRYYMQDKDNLSRDLLKKYQVLDIKEHPWFKQMNSDILTGFSSLLRFCYSSGKYIFYYSLNLPFEDALKHYDVVVDLNLIEPDKLTDRYDWMSAIGNSLALLNILYAKIAKKPVLVCAATIGPYENRALRVLAKYILNKVDVITLREAYSKDYLKTIGINKPPIYVSADMAFLMEPASQDDLASTMNLLDSENFNRPVVGIVPAEIMKNTYITRSQYIQLMAEISNYLIDKYGSTIIFIMNTYQDQDITNSIFQKIRTKDNARILPFDVSASGTKGVIGFCDLFICSRFHALVFSTSLSVPTIALVSYSYNKFHGIIGDMMGIQDYLLDIKIGFDFEVFLRLLEEKADYLLANREFITMKLKERNEYVINQALFNGKLTYDLINSHLRSEQI